MNQHQLNALRLIAKGQYKEALHAIDAAIDSADHPADIEGLKVLRVQTAEKAYPTRWRAFWQKMGWAA